MAGGDGKDAESLGSEVPTHILYSCAMRSCHEEVR